MRLSEQIRFVKSKAWCLGVERERFICRDGNIVPESQSILSQLSQISSFGPELSACQIEDRVGPIHLNKLIQALSDNDKRLESAAKEVALTTKFLEVAPGDMPLDVFVDAQGRYSDIAKRLGNHRLSAACRVAGTHIHVGMPSHDTALTVYNQVRMKCEYLIRIGDHSNGERVRLYKQVVPDPFPSYYSSWQAYDAFGNAQGWSSPRDCWDFIRLSLHGTIEFRTFGATEDNEEILKWANFCLDLCRSCV